MRIYDTLQGHLAQLEGRELHTLARKQKFRITRAIPKSEKQAEWLIKLAAGSQGDENAIDLTESLRLYTWLVSNYRDK